MEAKWQKPTRSEGANNCVEVAVVPEAVGVRDTKDRASGQLAVPPSAWAAFLGHLAQG
ncbi:DUF397 domain-containing protein [Amycolatopsis sp. NPDC059021]|uniref:DUF397 domain-containing protein n=1 Tax=Amycolatopsis sp. NPDC059021 TaxID=3346704 RepID=UPI00366F822F